jgi:hypothetical protein
MSLEVDSVFNINEYRECLLWVKVAGCVWLTTLQTS